MHRVQNTCAINCNGYRVLMRALIKFSQNFYHENFVLRKMYKIMKICALGNLQPYGKGTKHVVINT